MFIQIHEDWSKQAKQHIESRQETAEGFMKYQIEEMLKPYVASSGRWDVEGVRRYFAVKVAKRAGNTMAE